jgi:stage V sporulation protein AD
MDFLFAGDLLNQCIGSSYAARGQDVPYFGLYGACSTMGEGLILAAMALDGGFGAHAAVCASSHFCSAERQYRTPLEYGGQRTPTAQWTATAAGAVVLGREGEVSLEAFLPGRVVDAGINDPANMGAAMAPAAADTLLAYFRESGAAATDFDVILTGDLGREGSDLLGILLADRIAGFCERPRDGGGMLYDPSRQDVHAGGSGCGCIASMLAGVLLPQLAAGKLRRVLAVGTGALMNPASLQQGGTIAGVAHLVVFQREE